MAFNPFETFSVRSKVGRTVFALLGIVVMLTFVLSAGVGGNVDFFGQISGRGSSRGDKTVYARAYGDKITDIDIKELRAQRTAANIFMLEAVEASYVNLAKELDGDVKNNRLDATTSKAIEKIVAARMNAYEKPNEYGRLRADLMDRDRDQPPSLDAQLFAKAYQAALSRPESDEYKAIQGVNEFLSYDSVQHTQFFPTVALDNDENLITYALLLKKADALGVVYSADAVKKLVRRDTDERLTAVDNGEIEARLKQKFPAFTPDWLVTAIGNEYRARAVLTTLIGNDLVGRPGRGQPATLSAPPGNVTPYQFYKFYRDRTSEVDFTVLEVSAESFLDKVTEVPDPKKDLEPLFNKYRGEEPDLAREKPGFKDPRKVKVEFVTVTAAAPRIAQSVAKVQAASVFLSGIAGPMSVGGNGFSALTQAAQPAWAETLPARAKYDERVENLASEYASGEKYLLRPRDPSIYHPAPLAAFLAATALSRTPAADAAAALAYARGVELIENRTRVGVLLQGIVAPLAPLPPVAFGFPAFSIAVQPKPVPEAVFAKDYREQIRKEQIHNLYENDVKQFRDKLGEINRDSTALFGTKPDKAKADKAKAESRKLVDEWVKERGLTLAATAEARDRIALTTDPALKPLNDVAFPDPDGTNSLSRKFYEMVDFGDLGRQRFKMPEMFRVSPFQPDWFPFRPFGDTDEKPTFLVWMSEELPPTAYPNLTNANNLTKGEMVKRVERAWKLDKARVLAKAEADKLADQVRAITKTVATNPSGVDKQLIDLAGQMKVRKFELYRLAKLQHDHGATSAGGGGYRPATIDPLFVPYPTRFFADELLELRNKPLGEVTVLADAPRVKYYVACSVKKFEKPLDTFRDDVFTKTNAISPNPLYVQYALREERNKANREVGLRLRAEAGLELTEEFKKGERRESE